MYNPVYQHQEKSEARTHTNFLQKKIKYLKQHTNTLNVCALSSTYHVMGNSYSR